MNNHNNLFDYIEQDTEETDHAPADKHWGGNLTEEIDDTITLRITSKNINGFATQSLQAEFEILHQFKHRLRVGIIMLQVPNLNWRLPKIRELFLLTGK
jgi:hypothetical protein